MAADTFDKLLERMERGGVANRGQLRGCSAAEIRHLESTLGVRLPPVLDRYLRTMGHSAGRLFAHDHVDVGYAATLALTLQQRAAHAAESLPGRRRLPYDAVIVTGRLGEQFEFVRCSDSEDPPVRYFEAPGGRTNGRFKTSHRSVLHWLAAWCTEAEEAIASGYFDR